MTSDHYINSVLNYSFTQNTVILATQILFALYKLCRHFQQNSASWVIVTKLKRETAGDT